MLDIMFLYDSDCRASSLFEKSYKHVYKSIFSPLVGWAPPCWCVSSKMHSVVLYRGASIAESWGEKRTIR